MRPFERVALGDDVPPQDRARRLRLVCEDLGPTFVKLGQLLSTRPDLLPEAYTNELAALRDDVRPFPFAEAEAILTEEYGRPPSEVFAAIDPAPVASASISQVHRAVLRDGRVGRAEGPPAGDRQGGPGRPRHPQEPGPARRAPAPVPGPVRAGRPWPASSSGALKRELDFNVERRTMERCQAQFAARPDRAHPLRRRGVSRPAG